MGVHLERKRDLVASHKVFIGMKVPRMDSNLEQIADLISDCAIQAGHTPLIAHREIAHLQLAHPDQFMPFVRERILASDLIVILYHPELRGGLIEAGIAYGLNKLVWLLARSGEKVSSSVTGCADQLVTYEDIDDLKLKLQSAFEKLAHPAGSADSFMEV